MAKKSYPVKAMAKRGRKSKYNLRLAKRICDHIRQGVSLAGAAEICGVGHTAFHEWRNKHPEFADMVNEANGASEAALVSYAMNTARTDGRVAVQMLERRFQDRWQRNERREVSATHTLTTVSPQVVQGLSGLPESERQARIEHNDAENPDKMGSINV